MISFETPPEIEERLRLRAPGGARARCAPQARHYDDHEHEMPWDLAWTDVADGAPDRPRASVPARAARRTARESCHLTLRARRSSACPGATPASTSACPAPGLGGAAVAGHGHAEQKQRFLARYREGPAEVGEHGHDRAALRLGHRGHPHHRRARRRRLGAERREDLRAPAATSRWWTPSGLRWSSGPRSTLRPGRAGIKPFVVEAGTPGLHGHQAREEDGHPRQRHGVGGVRGLPDPARQPPGQRRGARSRTQGLQGRDGHLRRHAARRWRPARSASPARARAAEGAARRAKASRSATATPRTGSPRVERDVVDMEAQLRAARLLTWRGGLDDGPAAAEQPRGLDVQGRRRATSSPASRRRPSS